MYAIELEDDHIKICQAEFKEGKFMLKRLGWFPRPLRGEDIQLLKKMLKRTNVPIRVSIPRRKVSIHYPTFPSHKEEEVYQMARFQALRQFPYRDINVIHSANILSKLPNGYSKAMLAVIGQELLDKYLREIEKIVLPGSITINSLGILGFYRKIKGGGDGILLEVDADYTNLLIAHKGKLLFCREINKGYEVIREKGISIWWGDIQHSINSFNKEKLVSSPISKVAILGPRYIKFMQEERDQIPFPEVEFIYQEDHVERAEEFEPLGQLREGLSLIPLLGLTVLDSIEIDLTPVELIQELYRRRIWKERKKTLLFYGIALLEIFLILAVEYNYKRIYLKNMRAFLLQIDENIKLLAKRKEVIDLFLNKDIEGSFLTQFSEILDNLPPDLFLRRVEYRRGEEMIVEGESEKAISIYQFYEKLKGIPKVKGIKDFKLSSSADGKKVFYLRMRY